MTILIIVAILIAIAYIFGKRTAQWLVIGSGALALSLIGIGLLIALIYYLWSELQTNSTMQAAVGKIVFFFVLSLIIIGIGSLKEYYRSSTPEQKKKILKWSYSSAFVVAMLAFLYWGDDTNTTKDSLEPSTTIERSISSTEVRKYITDSIVNVRSCASTDCRPVGQYGAGEVFEFNSVSGNLPEWVEISWFNELGAREFGYLHKSTLREI